MRRGIALLISMHLAGAISSAKGADVWLQRSEALQSTPQVRTLAGLHSMCVFEQVAATLSLADVIERAICNNPRTRKAWASLVAQVSSQGVAQSAYLPTISANASVGRERDRTDVSNSTNYDNDLYPEQREGGIKLTFPLIDFGRRKARLDRETYLTASANASRDVELIAVFLDAARAFFESIDADGLLKSAQRGEEIALENLRVAEARFQGGTGVITEQLQARTAYLQNKVKSTNAATNVAKAYGSLAVIMGLDAQVKFSIEKLPSQTTDSLLSVTVDELITEAKRNNPQIAMTRAQLLAAEAYVKATIADGRPSVSLTAGLNRSERIVSGSVNTFGVNDIPLDSISRKQSIELQITVPLFDGFSRRSAIRQARAQAELIRIDMESAEHQLTSDVWNAYHRVIAQFENVQVTKELLSVAEQSLSATEERYRIGSGNIIDVLSAQSALANAEQQSIEALSGWRTARIELAASLGNVGRWTLEQ